MRLIFSFLSVLAVAACLPNPVWAQVDEITIDDLEYLTPEALVADVELHNHHLLSSTAAIEAAQFRIGPASALEDPMVSYMMLPRSIGSDIGFRHGGEISQSFPWPGKRDLHGDVATQQRNIALEDLSLTRLDVVAAAKFSFAEWHYLHRAIDINSLNQQVVEDLIAVAQARYSAGRASQQDVLQAEVELALLQQQRLALNQQVASARASMNLLLNRDIDAYIPPPAPFRQPGSLPSLDAARLMADETHPYLRRQEALIEEGHARVELADKAFFPDFQASLGYADTWDERDKRVHLRVAINVPLGREKRHAELDAARAEVRRNEHELQGHRQELLAQMEAAYAETHESLESMRLYEDRLMPLAQASFEVSLSDYQSGVGQFINVLTAQRQQLSTAQGYERTRADYWRRRAALERAAGMPLGEGTVSQTAIAKDLRSVVNSPFAIQPGESHE